jgi:sugar transferase (PEP-CTERM/EpsH1 system associated)
MDDLLLLVHRLPYPPDKGDKIRSHGLLRHLSQRYRVHLASFVDQGADWQHVPAVQAMCASTFFAPLAPWVARTRSLGALAGRRALSLAYYRHAGMQRWVDMTMARHRIERILAFSSPMAQYAEHHGQAHRIIDFCDVDSDKWRQYSERQTWPLSWLYRREARALLAYERRIAAGWDAALFVSAAEADLFRALAPESGARVSHFNAGVDTTFFAPGGEHRTPYPRGERALVFTGAMDYWPNVDAVQWFADAVFPRLLAAFPQLRFYIVGAHPTRAVRALGMRYGVVVTGAVPDIRPYLQHAKMAVAPLRIARGVQNKVLEAMAMARPVVISLQAFEGIDASAGRELLVADGADAFFAAIASQLARPDPTLGTAARARIERSYRWPANLAALDDTLASLVSH